MAGKRILNNDQFFSEVHTNFPNPVRIINEQGMSELIGRKADVHLHSPATEKLGRPIYSVLVGGLVQGQSENIYLKDAKIKIDKKQLQAHLDSPTGAKTRNTFSSGIVDNVPEEPPTRRLDMRPGIMRDFKTKEDVSSGVSDIHLTSRINTRNVVKPFLGYTPYPKK
jgi:hypothetical protein